MDIKKDGTGFKPSRTGSTAARQIEALSSVPSQRPCSVCIYYQEAGTSKICTNLITDVEPWWKGCVMNEITQEILSRHPDWQDEERRRQEEKADKDSERWEIGGDR